MNVGSYNYLHSCFDLEELLGKTIDLERMADRLENLPETDFPGSTAAGHMTRLLLLKLQLWESHAMATRELLSGVWKGVEWWDSNDWGPDEVREELQKLLSPGDKT